MDPVLGREVVKGQQRRPVFVQDGDRLGVFGPKIPREAIEGLTRLGLWVSAIQISCNPALALPWTDFGKALSTLAVL